MKTPGLHRVVTTLWFITCFVGVSTVCAQDSEKKVKMSDLPEPVKKTVREQSKGAVIRGLSKEIENGQTSYEVELKVQGHNRDVLIDPNGAVLAIEEQVALNAVPPAAKAEIVKRAGKGKILKVESITRNDVVVEYEAQVSTGGKKSEVKVTADGKSIDK